MLNEVKSRTAGKLTLIIASLLAMLSLSSCDLTRSKPDSQATDNSQQSISQDEAKQMVLDMLDDFEQTDQLLASNASLSQPGRIASIASLPGKKAPIVFAVTPDSTFVFGDTATIDGHLNGVVVTEKHAYPKGLLLITKSMKYAPSNTIGVASITEKYVSWSQYKNHTPETKTITVAGPQFSSGTDSAIEAHVTKIKGSVTLTETFKFTEPIRTFDMSKSTISVRAADPSAEQVITAVYDMNSGIILTKRATGQGDVSLGYGSYYSQSYTYSNGVLASWTKTTTLGQADKSILKVVEKYP
jgi:hypothetical protein